MNKVIGDPDGSNKTGENNVLKSRINESAVEVDPPKLYKAKWIPFA